VVLSLLVHETKGEGRAILDGCIELEAEV